VVLRGIDLKLDLALDKLGPSIAMLPSADAAMVAFAEVTSFVRFYATSAGEDALPKLFAELKNKKNVDEALVAASGSSLAQWDQKWRAYLATVPRAPLPKLMGLGAATIDAKTITDFRERVRLGELLLGRDHAQAALAELDRAPPIALEDPSTRHLRARAFEALGKISEARAEVASPSSVLASYGPWWAIRARLSNDASSPSDNSFWEAIAADPYDVEVACQAPNESDLCAAAKARGEPEIGRD